MKKLFQIIGIMSLMGFSFFYTEKTIKVVKEYDDIMLELREYSKNNKKECINAIIKDNTIIPGISGEEININKSYSKMKRYGKFEKSLIVKRRIKPKISIKNNKTKIIVKGNNSPKITLIFLVNENDKLDNIINILERKKIKANLFVDGYYLEKNTNMIIDLIKKKYIIGNLSYNMDYRNQDFIWIDNIIKKIGKQKEGYCYADNLNKNFKMCHNNNNYIIKPSIIIKDNPYKEVKDNIENGSIISFEINNKLEQELPIIINYIKSRGYELYTLDNFLEE